jgi:ABC-type sugar transport system permease subunit
MLQTAPERHVIRTASSIRGWSGQKPAARPSARETAARPLSMLRLLLPMLVFILLLVGLPLVYAAWLSFTEFRFGSEPVFNGIDNYLRQLDDPLVWSGLKITFVL